MFIEQIRLKCGVRVLEHSFGFREKVIAHFLKYGSQTLGCKVYHMFAEVGFSSHFRIRLN